MRTRPSFLLVIVIFTAVAICGGFIFGCSQKATEAEPQTAVAPALSYIGQWGVKGDGPGHLQEPASIATDVLGNAYIADAGSQFIHKFDPQGTPLLSFQEDPLKHPQWITIYPDGDVYLTDPVRS